MSDLGLLRKSSLKTGVKTQQQKQRHVFIRLPEPKKNRPMTTKSKLLVGLFIIMATVSALSGYFIGRAEYYSRKVVEPPDPEEPLPPSPSWLHVFQKAAVCTDAPHCSQIGRDILLKNGSAVDAAIAAMFCNHLLNQQSMGLGGGFFMTVYIKDEEKAYSVNAREKAPAAATKDMFQGSQIKSSKGPLAVGVPGELRGMWAAHKRWGRLPWKSLITPNLEFCKYGFPISLVLYQGLDANQFVKNDPLLSAQYYDSTKKEFYKPGTVVKPSAPLCRTLEIIADRGGDELYEGALAKEFLDDLNRVGSIITADDLRNYQPKITEPLQMTLDEGTLYAPPLPSSGIILINILSILKQYHFSPSSIDNLNDTILTYHRTIEAFKHAYGLRTKLGDDDFVDVKELIKEVTSSGYAKQLLGKINDLSTSNDSSIYGATTFNKGDGGTAHISVIAGNGDAVSVTSSINFYFGAGFSTLNTGIIMNNVMDDFSSPGIINGFGLKPSPANFIAPGKRPLSSMSPSIVVDKAGNAIMVIGASGGTKITSAISLVLMRNLWFKQTIKESVDAARIHHQIFPMDIEYEYGVLAGVIRGLRAKGHGVQRYRGRGSIVCAMYRNSTGIYANSDFRKGGDVAGLD